MRWVQEGTYTFYRGGMKEEKLRFALFAALWEFFGHKEECTDACDQEVDEMVEGIMALLEEE